MKDEIQGIIGNIQVNKDLNFKCSKCNDVGYVIKDNVAYICSCKAAQKRKKAADERYTLKDYSFVYYEDQVIQKKKGPDTYLKKAKELVDLSNEFVAKAIAGKKQRGLFIQGNVGSGKTHICKCILNDLLRENVDVKFYSVPDLLEDIRENIFNEDKFNLMKKIRETKVLILDDLGAHTYTPFVVNKLYQIFNYRLNNDLPIVINTNLSFKEVEELIDERISSRILEMCKLFELRSDTDIRLKKYIEDKL